MQNSSNDCKPHREQVIDGGTKTSELAPKTHGIIFDKKNLYIKTMNARNSKEFTKIFG